METDAKIIEKLRVELTRLIENKANYNLILKKSQELDEYIFKELLEINNLNRKK